MPQTAQTAQTEPTTVIGAPPLNQTIEFIDLSDVIEIRTGSSSCRDNSVIITNDYF